ncbi:class I SAM-dependent methyltransferase [Shumkonia mesophila]|uniref:class I SAM-dependent methyltransferase n=1 Tax=Shumkonia mesophila TaxID=2838854 RepID=UPI002935115B|nr:SAM-dependent methyltransferase [Shumkonia mesophila]
MAGGLLDVLLGRIALGGPLTVADYMAEALGHPRFGYYATRDPFGAAGDFVTAPEVSQMFGELIGLWGAVVWQAMGRPDPVRWVELGPGRGTLMADAIRASRTVPGFVEAARLHLVETSPVLRRIQAATLAKAAPPHPPLWHADLSGVPDGPMILVANEFLDALPIRQFERTAAGWCERLVAAGPGGDRLIFVLSPPSRRPPLLPAAVIDAPVGAIAEVSPAVIGVIDAIGRRLAGTGGAALIVDYGHPRSAPGDTLQAVRGHAYHDPLADPGQADLTAHVDFEAVARAAGEAGARPFGPIGQGLFLERLGLGARADALLAGASPAQADAIRAARHRLTAAGEMGTLFKAVSLQHPGLPPPPGFA